MNKRLTIRKISAGLLAFALVTGTLPAGVSKEFREFGPVAYAITPAPSRLTDAQKPAAQEGLMYNGEEQALLSSPAEPLEGYEINYSIDDGATWYSGIPTGVDAGDYTISVKYIGQGNGDDKYEDFDIDDITVTIAKKSAPSEVTAKTDLYYTGEAQELVNAPTFIPADYVAQYSTDDGETWSGDIPTGTEADDYTVMVRFVYEGEHSYSDINADNVEVTIAKVPAPQLTNEQKPVAKENLIYTGEDQELVDAPAEPLEGYELKYSSDGEEWVEEIPAGNEIGDYTVKYKYEGDENHEDSIGEDIAVRISVIPAPESLTVDQKPVAAEDLYYTGRALKLVVAPVELLDGYTIEYSADSGKTWSEEIPTGLNAGSYKVKFRFVGDENHESFESDSVIPVTINKANIELGHLPVEGLVYDGNAQELVTPPANIPAGYTAMYSVDNGKTWSEEIPTGTDAGEYEVYAKFAGDSNHEDIELSYVLVTIDKTVAGLTDANKPAAIEDLVYTGEDQELIEAPEELPEGYTVEYAIDNSEWSEEIPTGKLAGDYTVAVKYVGDDNHEDIIGDDITVTIAEADGPSAPAGKTGLVYNGEAQELITPATNAPEGYIVKYSIDGGETWSEEIPTGTEAGEYTIKVKYEGDNNHEDFNGKDITVTIAEEEKPVELTDAQKPTAKTDLIENGEAQELVNAPEEAVEGYTINYSTDGETWSEEIPAGTEAGDYTVQYKYVSNEDAVDIEGGELGVTIAEAAKDILAKPTVVIKTAFGGRTVQLNCNDPDAEIYYNFGSSNITTECEHVKAGETIFINEPKNGESAAMFFKAYKDGEWSEVGKWGVLNVQIAAPIIRQSGPKTSDKFRIYTETKDSYIIITMDGTDPSIKEGTQKLEVTNGRIIWGTDTLETVPKGRTIKAIAVRNGLVTSDVLEFTNNG